MSVSPPISTISNTAPADAGLVGVGLVEEPFGAEDFRRLEAAAGAQGAEITDGEVKPHTNSVPIDPKALEIVGHEHFQACTANQQFHRTLENENR